MGIAEHIRSLGYQVIEGSSSQEQTQWFHQFLQDHPEIKRIAEIGFNQGVGAEAFLSSRDDVTVVSFDIGWYQYSIDAENYISKVYPGRHQVVWGDSRKSIPNYIKDHPEDKFDLIFIDGGHHYDVSRSDLIESFGLSHRQTVLVMDDMVPWLVWGYGPTRAWSELTNCGFIHQDQFVVDGKIIMGQEANQQRGERIWVVGHYTPSPN